MGNIVNKNNLRVKLADGLTDFGQSQVKEKLKDSGIVEVSANPEVAGTEEGLNSIEIGGVKYKVEGGGGTDVEANPTFDGTEEDLKGLQIGNAKYRIPIQKYVVFDIYDLAEEILDAVKPGDVVIDSDGTTYHGTWIIESVETTTINNTLKNISVKLTSFEGIVGSFLTYTYDSQEQVWSLDEDVSMNLQKKCIAAKNVSASNWVSDSTYADYAYKCVLDTFVDVTSDDFVQVQFSKTDAESGNYAPFCETGSGTVTIYSKVNTSITIELMYCLPLDTGGIL